MNKLYQAEPEIREDLQGRIEVFDQSIRSFEKRLRAVERRLSVETPPALQAGIVPGNFSVPFQDENTANIATGSSIFPQMSSISPESSIDTNSFLSNSAASISAGNISSFGFSAVLHSGETPNLSAISVDAGNSSEISGKGYKIRNINEVFSSISESLRSMQVAISDLSNFAYNNLKPEVEKLDIELSNLKAQQDAKNAYIMELESRIEILENQNRLTLGSMKIPFEISGVAGSSALFLAGFLIWSDRWDVIRSPYFSTGLALLMAGAVFMKFYMVNRRKKALTDSL